MIDRDDHHVVFLGELHAVVADEAARATRETTAVQPDHDRELAVTIQSRRPYI